MGWVAMKLDLPLLDVDMQLLLRLQKELLLFIARNVQLLEGQSYKGNAPMTAYSR